MNQLTKESGAVTIMFAGMFPTLLLFFSIAIDGTNINISQARLIDSIYQGLMAVALTDNHNVTITAKQENKKIMKAYARYYLAGNDIPEGMLNVDVYLNNDRKGNLTSVDYAASALSSVDTFFSSIKGNDKISGFGAKVDVFGDSGSSVLRKTINSNNSPTDFTFVVDFSLSMAGSRLNLLKKIIADFSYHALVKNDIGNTIGIVPYAVGTPVILDEKNIIGGNQLGCSFTGKLKDTYDIDFSFWYDKNIRRTYKNYHEAAYDADENLYFYYNNYIRPNVFPYNIEALVSRGWCRNNVQWGSQYGRYRYSCGKNDYANMFEYNPVAIDNKGRYLHKAEFKENYQIAAALIKSANHHYNIINIDTLDIDATLTGDYLFSDKAVTTYIHHFTPYFKRPFAHMCNADQDYNSSTIKSIVRPKYYPIEQTNNSSFLNEFSNMMPGGWTDSTNGLLRAVPVIAKGNNTKKIIIIITDGEETGSEFIGPLALRNLLVRDHGLCDVIKSGLLHYPVGTPTISSDIYYISLVDDNNRMKFWADHCVGEGKSIVARNYKELRDVLTAIASNQSLTFINKDELEN